MIHKLKIWPQYFEAKLKGLKPWELRLNDRNFRLGDILLLQEFDPKAKRHTGRERAEVVSYILHGGNSEDAVPVHENYCLMSTRPPNRDELERILVGEAVHG